MSIYFQPLVQVGSGRHDKAVPLAGGAFWFDRVLPLERGKVHESIPAIEAPGDVLARLSAPRADVAGLSMDKPRLMAVLNVTPDSFSDGGKFDAPEAALRQANALINDGADLLDVGGESTRPGAEYVAPEIETARTAPIIRALVENSVSTPVSIDTRKASVAKAALEAGASVLNDVSALSHDPDMAKVAAQAGVSICLMHAQGDPKTMQQNPEYNDVVLDVYDYLSDRIAVAEAAGIERSRIIVDPGIGFGKTLDHNLALLRGLSLFHTLGCVILLGVSRKRFIGTLSGVAQADARVMGSVAIGLEGLRQGVQILRVHDIEAHAQALACWQPLITGHDNKKHR